MSYRPHLLILALAAALSVSATPAAAAAPRSFFGVQATPDYPPMASATDFSRMAEARVGTLRLDFNWQGVQHDLSTPRDWRFYDATMRRTANAGVTVLAHLIGSPSFAAARSSNAPRTSLGRREFRRFVGDVVRRYGRGGSFWRTCGCRYKPVKAYQVWNEVNLPFWWSGHSVSAKGYASLLKLISREIRRNDPKATVVLAGLPEGKRGVRRTRYLARLYRTSRRVKRYFDAVAIHPYARTHRGVKTAVRQIRRVMRRYRDRKTKLWITESGWADGGRPTFTVTSTSGQATKLRKTFRMLRANRRRYRISRVIWFTWKDLPVRNDGNGDWWGLHCGLFRRDGSPKPAWFSFRSFSRATR